MKTPRFNISVYADVLSCRPAWRFDAGTVLMRMYCYMFTLGTVSMLTLTGYSAFVGGTVAATLSVSNFLIGPRVAKLIDLRGQNAVVPWVAAVSLAGLAALIAGVLLAFPLPALYAAAVVMGCMPSPGAMARTRWAYLIRTGRFDTDRIAIRTAYSYEGILEDAAFAVAPAICIALSAAVHPALGLVFGGVLFLVGVIVLMSARDTLPPVGWDTQLGNAGEEIAGEDVAGDAADPTPAPAPDLGCLPDFSGANTQDLWSTGKRKTVFALSPTVRTLFFCLVLLGVFFGSFDTTTIVFCQSLGTPALASPVMIISGVLSLMAGFLFGMTESRLDIRRMLLITGTLMGVGYFTNFFICNAATLLVLTAVASPFYAPFFITANTAVERAVPGSRLTEGITWINAGTTLGFAVGPSVSGLLNDLFGPATGYKLVGVAALLIPVVLLCCRRALKRDLG